MKCPGRPLSKRRRRTVARALSVEEVAMVERVRQEFLRRGAPGADLASGAHSYSLYIASDLRSYARVSAAAIRRARALNGAISA